jgi:hypothetical protein
MGYKNKEDQNSAARKHYQKNKKAIKLRNSIRKRKQNLILRQYCWDYLKENNCVKCGESNPIVLQFDHLRDKEKNITKLMHSSCKLIVIQEEIEKCQVLCANCHLLKTAEQFGWYKDIIK